MEGIYVEGDANGFDAATTAVEEGKIAVRAAVDTLS